MIWQHGCYFDSLDAIGSDGKWWVVGFIWNFEWLSLWLCLDTAYFAETKKLFTVDKGKI